MTDAVDPLDTDLSFGPFRLSSGGLFEGAHQLRVSGRALRILTLLAANAGQTLSKQDLIAAVWPGADVVEGNLTVHIAALRRILGNGDRAGASIVTVPGRGYRLIGPVARGAARPQDGVAGDPGRHNLPSRLTTTVGREGLARAVDAAVRPGAVVTIVGPAGVGKTTLAVEVAEMRLDHHHDGVWLVDLGMVGDAGQIASALGAALRLNLGGENPLSRLAAQLEGSDRLLVLDNCEHLRAAVVEILKALMAACPSLAVIATSREPLGVAEERLEVLAPLSCPPGDVETAQEALAFPAVQLLVERASGALGDFSLTDDVATAAATVCRRLDGLPLAIEFAAPLVGLFGLRELAERLDDEAHLPAAARRGGDPRHRSLATALEWSYQTLASVEQAAFRRFAVFAGGFTLDAAIQVGESLGVHEATADIVAVLVEKSLLQSDLSGAEPRFRFLETTRRFALDRLDAEEGGADARRAHARYYAGVLDRHREAIGPEGLDADLDDVDNIRSALRWAVEPDGDADLALALAAGALPTWFGQSSLAECRTQLAHVIKRLRPDQRDSADGWTVAVALRTAEIFTKGVSATEYRAWSAAPAAAGRGPHAASPAADILTRWTWHVRSLDIEPAVLLARQHAALIAGSDRPYDHVMSHWVLGSTAHHAGDFPVALQRLSAFLEEETEEIRRVFLSYTGFDRTPGARGVRGQTWALMGDGAAALTDAEGAEQLGRDAGQAMAACEAMIWSGSVFALLEVEPERITRSLADLTEQAERHSLSSHLGAGRGLQGVAALRAGRPDQAEALLTEGVAILEASGHRAFHPWFAAERARAILVQDRIADAAAVLDAESGRTGAATWCEAEFLRARGAVFERQGDAEGAAAAFEAAATLGQRQGALLWEARALLDLARLWSGRGSAHRIRSRLIGLRTRLSGRALPPLVPAIDAALASLG